MDWTEALEIVIAETGHERYRDLCSDDHPDRDAWRANMVARATGEPSYPSYGAMARNALGAAARVVGAVATGQRVLLTQSEIDARLAVCTSCDRWDEEKARCRKCGCAQFKLHLATEVCPLSKWEPIDDASC
jgi:hypothetical protein